MFLTYVDESHSRGIYFLGALMCPESEAIPLAEALDDVVEKAMDDHGGFRPETELHGYDIFQGKKDFAHLASKPRARIGIYAGALQAIADHDVKIILRGVNVTRLERRYGPNHDEPHSIVLTHLLERVDMLAERKDELALIIADECDGQEQYRNDLRVYRRAGTWGYRSRKITRVVDTMHFASSAASRLLQAADLVTFLHHRIQTGAGADPRAKRANEGLWSRVAPKVHHQGTWMP
ncbi:DUF3800 domain-containing protein [[Kitasatospora] papulosa]|uniref:DUF3800 domain-containing protein n=1 Tax=[Kitasatospora] papulosa TaxID=1464011 RepID=UPI003697ED1C